MTARRWLVLGLTVSGLALGLGVARAVGPTHAQSTAPAPARPPAPAETHGTPKGWRFAWPKGDPVKGRALFQKLECYSCHEVRGERFPAPSEPGRAGPELSVMGPLHPPEFFAESIINPGAVIERGRGYAAPDGSSKMPSYADALTIQEAIDLVAYLRQLKPPAGGKPAAAPAGGHKGHSTH